MEQISEEIANEVLLAGTSHKGPVQNGHDFIEIFGIALRSTFGSKSRQESDPKHLSRALRLAYESEDFKQTRLYSNVKHWSRKNQGFEVFE